MALVVEDGTGLSTAESYISVADAETRLSNRGNTTWAAATDSAREAALRNATDYLEQRYRSRWLGVRVNSTQALSWPRYGVVVDGYSVLSTIVPTPIVNACADLALKSLGGEVFNDDLAQGIVREKVGPLETEYDRNSPQVARYPAISQALAPFLMGSSITAMLVRV